MTNTPTTALSDALAAAAQRHGADPTTGELPPEPAPTTAVVPAEAPSAVAPTYAVAGAPPAVLGALPWAATYMRLARTIANTELVPRTLRGRPDAVMAAAMYGFELGLGPMQSLNVVQIIDGAAGLKPEGMRALIQQEGHTFILSATETEARVRCRRKEWPEGEMAEFVWTMADARRAGIARKGSGWEKYPRAMLSARVTSEAARANFADVLHGLSYTGEELEDMAYDDGRRPAGAPLADPAQPATPDAFPGDGAPAPSDRGVNGGSLGVPAEGAPPAGPPPRKARAATKKAPARPEPSPEPDGPPAEAPRDDVHREMVRALNELVNRHQGPQRTLLRAYLAQHGWGAPDRLDTEALQDAINVAAGWPTSAGGSGDPAPGEEADEDVAEAELLPAGEEDDGGEGLF